MRIFLDMDDVLVDFVAGALALHGTSRRELGDRWELGTWDLSKILGITPEQFWEPIIAQGSTWWAGLQPLCWMDTLLELVVDLQGDWHILSDPGRAGPSAVVGKTSWLKNHRRLKNLEDRLICTPHKHLFAKSGAVLIDDREEVVTKFTKEGGYGLLFPTRGNYLYPYRYDPVGYIVKQLKSLKE